MAKYLGTWEMNQSLIPTNPKEMAAMVVKMAGMIKQEIKEGQLIDWGCSIDGLTGYFLTATSALETYKRAQQYYPYVKLNIRKVLSVDDVLKAYK